jgi:hypothetical protein
MKYFPQEFFTKIAPWHFAQKRAKALYRFAKTW